MFPYFKRNSEKAQIRAEGDAIYRALFALSRAPAFYREYGVPDTLDGRFGLLSLQVFCFIHFLNTSSELSDNKHEISQAVFDTMFRDMDISLREAGVGDLGVPRRVKQMMEAFNGACHAYGEALADDSALAGALIRNVYGVDAGPGAGEEARENAGRLVRYARALIAALSDVKVLKMMAGAALPLPDPEKVL